MNLAKNTGSFRGNKSGLPVKQCLAFCGRPDGLAQEMAVELECRQILL